MNLMGDKGIKKLDIIKKILLGLQIGILLLMLIAINIPMVIKGVIRIDIMIMKAKMF